MAGRRLTVVPKDAKPRRAKPKTVKAALDGSERDVLVAMRAKAASELDGGVPAHALAPLMRQLRDLDREIRAIDVREEQEGAGSGPTEDEEWSAI